MLKITDNEIDNLLKSNKNVLIKYSAAWCNPCKTLSPILESVQKDNSDILIIEADVTENEKSTKKYNIKNVPTCILVSNGEEVARFMGTKTSDKVIEFIKEHTN